MSAENEVANLLGSMEYLQSAGTIGGCIAYGIFIPIFFLSCYITRNHKLKNHLLVAHSMIMVSSTGIIIADVGLQTRMFSFALIPVHGSTPSWGERLQSSQKSAIPYAILLTWCTMINFIIGDAIIAWRAYVLWSRSLIIKCMLLAFFIGNIGIALYNVASFMISVTSTSDEGHSTNTISTSTAVGYFASLGSNLFATSLILLKSWLFRQTMKDAFIKAKKSTAYQVLVLIIECGLLFGVVQLAAGLITLSSAANDPTSFVINSRTLAYYVISAIYPILSGIVPLLMIIIVAGKRSMIDQSMSSKNLSLTGTSDLERGTTEARDQQLTTMSFVSR
ncbi:hypothetical protein VKT23_009555 [Stygiomarasmius scandens]|uniref:Uncharacterized protein n=1 Tax=Marasmiellus scandens TaxID=2682957 RepID=A0ABR1JEY7_9AGAR